MTHALKCCNLQAGNQKNEKDQRKSKSKTCPKIMLHNKLSEVQEYELHHKALKLVEDHLFDDNGDLP